MTKRRWIGNARIDIRRVRHDEYAGIVSVELRNGGTLRCRVKDLYAPAYFKRDVGLDDDDMYDHMTVAAVERAISTPGPKSPDGYDPTEVLLEAVESAIGEDGGYTVERDDFTLNPCGGSSDRRN